MASFSFQITAKDPRSRARAGIIQTRHGKIETPYLIPVATRGNIIALSNKDVANLKIQVLLANTYHLHFMPPGDKAIKKQGGLHKIMHFNKPIFTDSGGFQALSLGKGKLRNIRKIGFFPGKNKITNNNNQEVFAEITNKGIIFTSVYNNKKRFMGPKESMQIQSNLGGDIIMAFDQCNCAGDSKAETKQAMKRSHKWELESLKHKDKSQALYGIIHGGTFKDLRLNSTKFILSRDFDGIAIGGSMGKTKPEMYKILSWVTNKLKEDKRPRHLLGIGWIDDIFNAVEQGIDTFDCVEMTRIARHGSLYISPKSQGSINNKFRLDINKARYSKDNKKIDFSCSCFTCMNYKRKDLHNMYKSRSKEYNRLATIHNVHFMLSLMEKIRNSIRQGNFKKLKKEWLKLPRL